MQFLSADIIVRLFVTRNDQLTNFSIFPQTLLVISKAGYV